VSEATALRAAIEAGPGPTRRPSPWRLLLVGFAAGALAATAVAATVARLHRAAEIAPAPFLVERDTIRLRAGAPMPLAFETAEAQLAEALPLPAVAGRVTTVESLTSPSFAPLSGRVVDVKVRIGSKVREGDKLIEVRAADLATMQREQRAARLAVRTKQAHVDRLQQLVDSRAASLHDLVVAQSELDDARFTVQAADARLRSLMVTQEGDTQYWVLAARSGVVVQLEAPPGKQVGPGSDKPIATVADLDEVLVLADVPQKEAGVLAPGLEAAISLPGSASKTLVDKIEAVSDVVDPDRQTVPVRIRARNPAHVLRPNAYVDVVFSSPAARSVLQVPVAAVVTDGNASVVFVEIERGVLRKRAVQVGRQTRDRAEIVAGLERGERVVTRGALLLLNALHVQG
jgi:cobalt-zinc-cadmium efflux system membrane fusion protein